MSQKNISKALFLKNTLYGVVQQTLAIISAFILLPYMVWHMGPDHYGLWLIAKIFSIGGYMSLAEMGFAGSITRYLTKYLIGGAKEEYRKLYFSGLIFFVFIGFFCFFLVFLFNKFFILSIFNISADNADLISTAVFIYGISLIFQFPAEVVKSYYMSRQDFFKLRLWETLNIIMFMIVVMPLLIFNTSIVAVVMAETSVYFCLFVLFFGFSILKDKEYCKINFKYWSIKSLKNITGMTYYLFFNRLFGTIYNKTPHIAIAIFLSPVYMTYYSIIDKIPKAIKALQGMINTAVAPFAVALDTLDETEKMKKLFLRGTRYSFLFITPLIVFSIMYSKEIIALWMGKEYEFLSTIMIAYILLKYISLFVSFGMSMYTRTKNFKDVFAFSLVACLIFIGTVVLMIGHIQLWAIVLGLFLSAFISIYIHMKVLYRINAFNFTEFFKYIIGMPIIGGAILSFLMIWIMKMLPFEMNFFILIIYGIVFYGFYLIFIYFIGLIGSERKELRLLFDKIRLRFTNV